jgi:hypothetical protein
VLFTPEKNTQPPPIDPEVVVKAAGVIPPGICVLPVEANAEAKVRVSNGSIMRTIDRSFFKSFQNNVCRNGI